jgi:predicted XRE-type DNA-binding protein
MKPPPEVSLAEVLDELQMIKRLMAIGLLRTGLSQAELATALGVNQSTVSRMVAGGKPKAGKANKQ